MSTTPDAAPAADEGPPRGEDGNASADTGDDVTRSADGGSDVGSRCPDSAPSPYGGVPCTTEGMICEYYAALDCPIGCSGGDYHAVACSKGTWTDYRHTAGVPRCQCQPLDFPKAMAGTWLFGQAGEPSRYSWIRFSVLSDTSTDPSSPGDGTIAILAGENVSASSTPWWPCSGQGRWFITQMPETFEIRLPSTCGSSSETYKVTSRQSAIPSSLSGCLLRITLESLGGTQLEACKYADSQCNEAMTTCQAAW
jgi:hypothetical protein